MNQLQEAIVNGVVGVLVVVIGLAFSGLRQVIAEKAQALRATKKASELAIIMSLATTAVQAVEQMFDTLKGEAKAREAVNMLVDEAGKRGIFVSDDQARRLIESAVKEMNETKHLVYDELTKPTK